MIIIGAQYDVDLDQSAGGGESEKDLSWIYSEYRVDRSCDKLVEWMEKTCERLFPVL